MSVKAAHQMPAESKLIRVVIPNDSPRLSWKVIIAKLIARSRPPPR